MSSQPNTTPKPIDDDLRIRRVPERGAYDLDIAREIIDAALLAHVGTVRDGLPVVIPMLCARDGGQLLLHGAPASGSMRRGRGEDVCVTMTLLDGLVLARSAFNHSVNYRSVVVLGRAETIRDEDERARALDVITERLVPGRVEQLRPMSSEEVRQTAVLRVPLAHASTKIRTGPPHDDEADYDGPAWAGVVPLTTTFGEPRPDPDLRPGIEVPANIASFSGKRL